MAWEETHRVEVLNGVRLAAQQIDDIIYIIVAEHHAGTDRGSTVFRVNSDSGILEYEHTLCNTQQFPSHVIMWKWQDTLMFAAVANSENPPGSASRYSTQSPVYMWEGSHFDMMHTLPTYNPRALSHFNIRSSMFIAVANFQNDNGETSVDSDIFRYNVATNRFTLYQKLPTEAAIDIKYFCFLGDHISESFLIYASAYHTDEEGLKDYNTASVVYKLSDEEYFVPFQALRVSKITGWLPVRYPQNDKEGLLLLGATEEGVISYQYDGWRFVATGVYYDRSAFGPGLKSIRAFYYNNRTLISAANKQSGRYEYNVFSPVLRHHSLMGELQKEVSAWEEQMRRQVADAHSRVAALLEIALAAPTVNDPVVQLGDRVVFHDVEVENLITHKVVS
ncbi:thrombospondin-type laminin G domain and EAR repeat-containing protein-like [Homalodisca vitripennis]|uniref:thrombospondin-type laminin G domain and EAR repeat-containing protein-like n=1 Tax=Homalodisca vitripennis TaxID=197043 RepID=UPI001EECB183|nr:thrombospondin-type laminin G domain and EAR repeat-containing protein-like [Homalodisca vitripennis]